MGLSLDMLEDMIKNGLPELPPARGADLRYIDDDPSSYPDIFENVETPAEEFRKGCEVLLQFGRCRTESELGSYSDGQSARDKVNVSDLRLLDMGAAVHVASPQQAALKAGEDSPPPYGL